MRKVNESKHRFALILLALTTGCGGGEVTVSGAFQFASEPLEGVEVCLRDSDACASTGADGRFSLPGVPANEDVSFTVVGTDDLVKGLTMFTTGDADEDIGELTLLTNASADLAAAAVDVELISSSAHLLINVAKQRASTLGEIEFVPGVTITVTPDSGDGPYYFNDALLPDRSLTETSSAAGAVLANVPAGEYEVSIGTDKSCSSWFSWSGDGNSFKAVAEAGYFTAVLVTCD